jgi:predicted TIM-barrel fold metal-dependent hydrolase
MIFEGTFERYPRLKVVFAEYGFAWVPSLLWRMDQTWQSARRAVPWVKRPPSEYVADHVRFTTEPVIEFATPEYRNLTLHGMAAERTLLFSSDYPHWDCDDPSLVLKGVSSELRERIFRQNAAETFGGRLVRLGSESVP